MKPLEEMNKKIHKTAPSKPKKGCIANQRALSPIFATLIILAVVTVLFIPVFIWANSTSSTSNDSWQASGTIATERIIVEEVNLKYMQSDLCQIYVRNIGKTYVTINNVIVTAPDGTVYTYQKSELSTRNPITGNNQASIVQGDMLEIRITNLKGLPVSLAANLNKLFTVKVFTTRGVAGEIQIALRAQ